MKQNQQLTSEIRVDSAAKKPAAEDDQIVVKHSEIEYITLNTWVIWNHGQTSVRQVGARH